MHIKITYLAILFVGLIAMASAQGLSGSLIDSMNTTNGWFANYGVNSLILNSTGVMNGSVGFNVNPNAAVYYSTYNSTVAANSVEIEKTFTNLNMAGVQNLYFWLYTQNASKDLAGFSQDIYQGVDVYLISNGNTTICPVGSASFHNYWTPIVVALSTCSGNAKLSNITAIAFQVNLNSSLTQNVTINIDDLGYNYNGGAFGKAQVILTFDGSWDSTIINATPIMIPNHQTGVAYIVTNQINQGGSSVNTNQINQLSADGWDVASHTVNHANLVAETSDVYPTGINNTYELNESQVTLAAMDPHSTPNIFAYPNGAYDNKVIAQVKAAHYITARGVVDLGIYQPNIYFNEPYNISYSVQSVILAPYVSVPTVESWIDQTEQQDGLLVLTFHIIQNNATVESCAQAQICYNITDFKKVSNYLAAQQQDGLLQVTNFSAYYCQMNSIYCSTSSSTIPTSTTTTSTTTTSTTVNSTTTVQQTGGGGGNINYASTAAGGNGGSTDLAAKPTITVNANGYLVSNVTQLATFNLSLGNTTINVTDNFITPSGTGLTIGKDSDYGLSLENATQIEGLGTGYDITLVNISYIPYRDTVQLLFTKPGGMPPFNGIIFNFTVTTGNVISGNEVPINAILANLGVSTITTSTSIPTTTSIIYIPQSSNTNSSLAAKIWAWLEKVFG